MRFAGRRSLSQKLTEEEKAELERQAASNGASAWNAVRARRIVCVCVLCETMGWAPAAAGLAYA